MIYLVELTGYDPATAGDVVLRYCGGESAYTTRPTDDPANAEYEGRVSDPGNLERHLFGRNRTYGESDIGVGVIKLANPDGDLDGLLDMTFDGRPVQIWALEDGAPFGSRELLFSGLIDDAEFGYAEVTVSIRDRLDALRETLQQETFTGETVSGGRADAEGGEDLKDKPKPEAYGRVLNVPAVEVDRFDLIYQIAANGLASIDVVRDRGVALTKGSDYATLAALKAATVTAGTYASCVALGLIKLGARADGQITVDASEGATAADRSAARVARRMLERAGFVAGTDFEAADFEALHALNPAEVQYWVGTSDVDALDAIAAVLGSVGGYLLPDRTGKFHVGRLELPTGEPGAVIDEVLILDGGSGIDRIGTDDEGSGKAARTITVKYGLNHYPVRRDELVTDTGTASDTTDAYRAFATEEWRQVKIENAAVAAISPDAPELTFETMFVNEADAHAEANRLAPIYSVRRDVFSVPVTRREIETIDLAGVVELQMSRFGLNEGRLFRVLGETANYEDGQTTLVLWG
ncbi:hypothetical protein U0C82_03680 [Fulvimarina sp. 2208YS6-2-32]|uniref:Phage tail protein n=1 Tax=Fulvimarina uroteuthidis TaxID=3098149 RepID=A0ABU5I0C1_9HYPH|nr:hypothetical protein [Fulvimarina sp. 2208YS6-2-32]MDY8108249.1 hypothetical protein [Fulvimarina sp. 2208YS6-2-32]